MWFDHHATEIRRIVGRVPFTGDCRLAPSAARVVFDYYGGRKRRGDIDEMMLAVDKADSAQFTREEILEPTGWNLLSFVMDARTGLGRYRDYRISNYQLICSLNDACARMRIDDILAIDDVRARVDSYDEGSAVPRDAAAPFVGARQRARHRHARRRDNYCGNRFMVYALYPDTNVSILGDERAREQEHRVRVRSQHPEQDVHDRRRGADAPVRRRRAPGVGHMPGRARARRSDAARDHRGDAQGRTESERRHRAGAGRHALRSSGQVVNRRAGAEPAGTGKDVFSVRSGHNPVAMTRALLATALVFAVLAASPRAADVQSASLKAELLKDWSELKPVMMAIAGAMPANKFTVQEHAGAARLRPADHARRHGQHGVPARFRRHNAGAGVQSNASSKADILQALATSFDYGEALIRKQTDHSMLDVVQTNRVPRPVRRRREVIYCLIGHAWDIYGQMAVFLGSTGSSREKRPSVEARAIDRVLEPELMDDAAQSRAYARADFTTSNQRFVDDLTRQFERVCVVSSILCAGAAPAR